ncbi:MAG TPA: RsbRD N-terminal domain-containing protein [Pyrinomonadaceae bacterium]|nr:RsbRD N-terminal domain-containing protein [Pyrinomonadaceae bacterium]
MLFAALFRENLDSLARELVDRLYADRRTDHARALSFRELVAHLPDLLDELAYLLDSRAPYAETIEAAKRLRPFAQARFQQGALLDEVARELMLLRGALNDFLWREAPGAGDAGGRELREALRRSNDFLDELIAQTILVYASSLRPVVETREPVWPPPRRRRRGGAGRKGEP